MIFIELRKLFSWKNILIFLFLGVACYFSFLFLKLETMTIPDVATDPQTYIVGYFLLPFLFVPDVLLVGALINDLLYFSICMVLIVMITNYYLEDSVTITLPRIGRFKWISRMFCSCFFYVCIALGIYLLSQFIYSGILLQEVPFVTMIVPICIKCCLGFSISCFFLYLIIRFKNMMLAILGSFGVFQVFSFLLRISIQKNGFVYENSIFLFLIFVCLLLLAIFLSIKAILTMDL